MSQDTESQFRVAWIYAGFCHSLGHTHGSINTPMKDYSEFHECRKDMLLSYQPFEELARVIEARWSLGGMRGLQVACRNLCRKRTARVPDEDIISFEDGFQNATVVKLITGRGLRKENIHHLGNQVSR